MELQFMADELVDRVHLYYPANRHVDEDEYRWSEEFERLVVLRRSNGAGASPRVAGLARPRAEALARLFCLGFELPPA